MSLFVKRCNTLQSLFVGMYRVSGLQIDSCFSAGICVVQGVVCRRSRAQNMLRQSGSDDRPALLCQAVGLAMMILLKAASSQNAWVESEWRSAVPCLIPFFDSGKGTMEMWLQQLVQQLRGCSSSYKGELPVLERVGESRPILWRLWHGIWNRLQISGFIDGTLRMSLFGVAFLLQQVPWCEFGERHGMVVKAGHVSRLL